MNIRPFNRSGVILASTLWIIIILSLLAASVARRAGIDASLMNYAVSRTQAYYAASAGVVYAVNLIREDSMDPDTQLFDSLYDCGVPRDPGRDLSKRMSDVPIGKEESFSIGYSKPEDGALSYGFEDEDRRLDLNALNTSNYALLSNLIVDLGFSRNEADIIAASVVDWQDMDEDVTHPPDGAESSFYGRSETPYPSKNRPFDHIDELRSIKGMRPEIFSKLEDYVTVYPQRPQRMNINFNTASLLVIRAVLEFTARNPGLDAADGESLEKKIIAFRNGPDGKPMTADDRVLLTSGNIRDALDLTVSEENLYRAVIQAYHSPVSNYFRIRVTGTDHRSSVMSRLECIVQRNPLTIVAWHRDP